MLKGVVKTVNSFYSEEELKEIGFQSYGKNVLISRKASIYAAEKMIIGNHVRIDDFCILSGKIELGDYIHISAYCGLFAGDTGIQMMDFTTLSSRGMIYAETDDYTGGAMTNPMIPDEYRNVFGAKVTLEKHVIVGSGSTILPGVTLEEGASVGSMSLVNRSLAGWKIYVGCPCRELKERNRQVLEFEKKFKEGVNQ